MKYLQTFFFFNILHLISCEHLYIYFDLYPILFQFMFIIYKIRYPYWKLEWKLRWLKNMLILQVENKLVFLIVNYKRLNQFLLISWCISNILLHLVYSEICIFTKLKLMSCSKYRSCKCKRNRLVFKPQCWNEISAMA